MNLEQNSYCRMTKKHLKLPMSWHYHLLDDSFQIFIAGKGEETENLKAEAADDKKIHFLGLVDDVELKGYFNAMDIFCFPSITKNEAFGIEFLKRMLLSLEVELLFDAIPNAQFSLFQ